MVIKGRLAELELHMFAIKSKIDPDIMYSVILADSGWRDWEGMFVCVRECLCAGITRPCLTYFVCR